MKSKNLILMVIALIGLNSAIIAQQKYAILIGGDPIATGVPIDHKWNNGQYPGTLGYDEIWNDTYLMWELLYLNEYGYTDENIHVLFANNEDYTFPEQDPHYKSIDHNVDHITDMMAKKSNVLDLLITMQTTVTENDYLFIWIMSHGGNTTGGDSYIYLRDYATGTNELLYDYELNQKLDLIPAMKKVVLVQAPNSGGFAEKLAASDVIVLTSSDKNEPAGRADNIPFTENETWGTHVYHHGEFGFHLYSSLNGESPAGSTNYGNDEFNEANIHEDDVISFDEAINHWLLEHHSTTEEPIYSDTGNKGEYMSIQFATIIMDNITEDAHFRGIVGVTAIQELYADVVITTGTTFFENTKVFFLDDTRLVSFGGILDVGENVVMTGNSPASYLYILTGINFAPGNLFTGYQGVRWGGIAAQNVSLFIDDVSFIDCHLVLDYIPILNVYNSNFIRSGILAKNILQKVDIRDQTFFTNSFCDLKFGSRDAIVLIKDCNFSGPVINFPINIGINMLSFRSYQIWDCIIVGYQDGIRISNCNTIPKKDILTNNSIHNNSDAGIRIWNSSAEILNNVGIYDNKSGIVCTDYSNIIITGNKAAVHASETQKIYNNDLNQIYSTYNSFPSIKWNAIWSDDNANCLVKFDNGIGQPNSLDISNNFWGPPELFNPIVDFCPVSGFTWLPVWNLQYGIPPTSPDMLLFNTAQQNIDEENYLDAESNLKQLISNYPSSEFADNALKELLPLENYLGENYYDLKEYYQSDSTILNNDHLLQVGNFLTAWCDVELENFPESIEYFENTIDSPPSFQDSIFAIIDLSYIYLLMDEGSKSSYTGKYAQYKFTSTEEYEKNTDYLLSLIGDESNIPDTFKQSIGLLKTGELLQNIPNPFSGSSQIWYRLDVESTVIVRIFDYTGKLIETYNQGLQAEGPHYIEFSAANLPSGIYFYSLELNGIKTDTKKMTLMR